MLEKSLQYQFSLLQQLLSKLSQEQFVQSLHLLLNHSVGEHVRHTLQFQENLMNGYSEGLVCYDNRNRECSTAFDIEEAKKQCDHFIQQLNNTNGDKKLKLLLNLNGENIQVPSTYYRELFYVHEHTIHHLAILRMGVENELGLNHELDDLGIATSTLTYLKNSLEK